MVRTVALATFAALLLGAIAALPLATSSRLQASQPYYPYPCPVISAGRNFSGFSPYSEDFGPELWDPRTGLWRLNQVGTDTIWGTYGDLPVNGDYNGDGTDDLAVWRPSTGVWHVKCSSTTNCAGGVIAVAWGTKGDIPVPSDYDNDGFTDFAVWRPTTGVWYIRSGPTGAALLSSTAWGQYGDCPVPGRLAGAGPGVKELNVWRPSNGTWYYGRALNGTGGAAISFGAYGDVPFSMDMTCGGDGDGDFVLFRPSTGVWFGETFTVAWGQAGDIPVPTSGQSGVTSVLFVWRPSNQFLYACFCPLGTSCGSTAQSFSPYGAKGDLPLSGRYY